MFEKLLKKRREQYKNPKKENGGDLPTAPDAESALDKVDQALEKVKQEREELLNKERTSRGGCGCGF